MQVKVFEAPDMAAGLKMVKDDLGPDALILSTRTIRSGKLGFLGKNKCEITAAVDSEWTAEPAKVNNEKSASATTGTYDRGMRVQSPETATASADGQLSATKEEQWLENTKLKSEVDELKGMMKTLGQEITRISGRSHKSYSPRPDNNISSLEQMVIDLGVSHENARTITEFAGEALTAEELTDHFIRKSYISDTIEELLQVSSHFFANGESNRQRRMALVGPTGVGKTTTLAKIAAGYMSSYSPSIGFITIDTYRIAAVEQLKVYGEIMDLPVEVVITPEQFEQAIIAMRHKDLILIDTAGRSPRDALCLEELGSYLRKDLDIEKHLVLSASTRENELYETIDRFSVLGLDHAIITKIDECSTLGVLLNLQIRGKLPFSFIANGQRVPEDIMEADKKYITSLIMSPGEGAKYD